jgi:hypothetical protein
MKSFQKYAPVILGSLAVGIALFVASFFLMDFVWTHIVVRDSREYGIFDGVVVIGGGLVVGMSTGVAGLVYVLNRFWPTERVNPLNLGEQHGNGKQQA